MTFYYISPLLYTQTKQYELFISICCNFKIILETSLILKSVCLVLCFPVSEQSSVLLKPGRTLQCQIRNKCNTKNILGM